MKRIIICADGTWNEPERRDKKTGRLQPTNVLKIARSLLPRAANGTEQVVYYHEGVGTGGPLDTVSGGAFGSGMELNVRALYRFIVNNYADGDELYFFGFSRGAFTVRTLSGFMDKVGLLHKRDEYYTPELYRLYESSEPYGSTKWEHAFRNVAERRPCPPIRFIGVFDTVGSLGAPGAIGQLFAKDKYKYHDIGLNNHIKNAYHALAIDERRKPFIPSLWEKPANWTGELKQVWFAGAHANAGGSYSPDGLANEALHWMVQLAKRHEVQFDDAHLAHYVPCFNSFLGDEMSMFYRTFGEYVRPIGTQLKDGEAVHQAVLDRIAHAECNYHPANLPAGLPVENTTGITRGVPCPPLQ